MIEKSQSNRETLTISLLMFSGVEGVSRILSELPEQLNPIIDVLQIKASIVVRKNNPKLDSALMESHFTALNTVYDQMSFRLVDDGRNFGFGLGHNLNYSLCPSDYLLILNDDLDFSDMEWLETAIFRMRSNKKIALIGDVGNPSAINPLFANGVFPNPRHMYSLRYAEASILIARGSAFQTIGMFDESIAWAMGEDSDLSFKAQQHGYIVDWIPIPHQHFRSTSFNSLPSYQKSTLLEHNRSRLFAKWSDALKVGRLGQYDVFDIFSDGLGDMFCSLLHIRQLFEDSSEIARKSIVVNCSSLVLANLILPDAIHIVSESDLNLVRKRFGHGGINAIRSIRQINYALPFNLHDILTAALSLPVVTQSTLEKITSDLQANAPKDLDNLKYCVVHLEFEREGHHGRSPSDTVKKRISKCVGEEFDVVVIIGKSKKIDTSYIDSSAVSVIDLQGRQSLSEMISTVANASHFVGIDSFPFHVAQAVGIPCATFFGSVNPILRALDQDLVWPIVANVDCLGCYHDQIESGAPFCMRMNDQCTIDISSQTVATSIADSKSGKPYAWGRIRRMLSIKQRNLLHYVKFHPAPQARLFASPIPAREISEIVYELTSKISSITIDHAVGAYVPQLQEENRRIRSELLDANSRLASHELSRAAPVSLTEMMPSVSTRDAMLSVEDCVVVEDGERLICEAVTNDPRIEFGPFLVVGRRFGVVIVSNSYPASKLVLYWRQNGRNYDERQKMVMDHSDRSASRIWWYTEEPSSEIFVRIDPSDCLATVSLKLKFVGDIRLQEGRFARKKKRLSNVVKTPSRGSKSWRSRFAHLNKFLRQ